MTELGSRLRMARDEKGISLDQLQAMTKIQKKYLLGIEEGDYSQIPGKFYVRAFIKQYAEAVGLSPDELFEEYKNEIPSAYEDDLSEQLSRVQTRKTMGPSSSKFLDLLPKISAGVAVVLVLFFIWYLFSKNVDTGNHTRGENKTPAVDIEESNEITPPGNSAEDKAGQEDKETSEQEEGSGDKAPSGQQLTVESVSGNTTSYRLSDAGQFELKVSAASGGETWLKILDGQNQVLFEGMLKDGARKDFDLSDGKEASLIVGRTLDTDIFVNGEKLEYELDPGQNILQEIRIVSEKE